MLAWLLQQSTRLCQPIWQTQHRMPHVNSQSHRFPLVIRIQDRLNKRNSCFVFDNNSRPITARYNCFLHAADDRASITERQSGLPTHSKEYRLHDEQFPANLRTVEYADRLLQILRGLLRTYEMFLWTKDDCGQNSFVINKAIIAGRIENCSHLSTS